MNDDYIREQEFHSRHLVSTPNFATSSAIDKISSASALTFLQAWLTHCLWSYGYTRRIS